MERAEHLNVRNTVVRSRKPPEHRHSAGIALNAVDRFMGNNPCRRVGNKRSSGCRYRLRCVAGWAELRNERPA